MNRIDRVTAILIQLQSRKIVKAQDIADRFGISLRTVYRDISTLIEAGVPIIGEAGVGYSIVDGYRLPPVMFTKEEATAFLTAEKLVEKFTDSEASYKSGMYKVRAVLRSTEKDFLENMEDHIEVRQSYAPFNSESANDTLQTLLKCISEKKVVHIQYAAFSSNETTERAIEPVGVFYANGYWHTIAFCLLRNDYRDFRADRMRQIRATDQPFINKHPNLKTFLKQIASKEELETIVINVNKGRARYLQEVKYRYGFVSEEEMEACIQMTFLTAYPEVFARWFLMFADNAEIVSPESLMTLLKDYVEKIFQKIYSLNQS